MTARPSHPGDPTPPPLNEEHMLEWIEGRLSRIEESNRAAASRAGVADRVRQMQANRRALQSLADERAPAQLMDRVMAALERETLLGLTQGEDVSDHPPISIATNTVSRNRRFERMAPGLALAAGLALLVGGAAYWGSILIKPSPRPGPAIADNSAAPADTTTTRTAEAVPAPVMPELTQPGPVEPATTAILAAAPLTDDRILQLAREGRLVIHVRARDIGRLAQIEAMTDLAPGRTWRISHDVPTEVATALQPAPMQPLDPRQHEPMIAGADGPIRRTIDWTPTLPLLEFQPVRETYLVDFPDSQRSLASLKSALADNLRAEVVFEELPEPLALPRTEDDNALLWWTLPPTSWTQRVTAPVIIQSR